MRLVNKKSDQWQWVCRFMTAGLDFGQTRQHELLAMTIKNAIYPVAPKNLPTLAEHFSTLRGHV
jgi:hypothetical protein